MWLVARGGKGTELSRRKVPDAVAETLRIWYTGQGARADEELAVKLVQEAISRSAKQPTDGNSPEARQKAHLPFFNRVPSTWRASQRRPGSLHEADPLGTPA